MRPIHLHRAAIVLIFALPLASLVFGTGGFAWTMYSRTGEFRFEIIGTNARTKRYYIAPTSLAPRCRRSTANVLAGADHYRRFPSISVLEPHLDEVALLACQDEGAPRSVEVTLFERADADHAPRVVHGSARCP